MAELAFKLRPLASVNQQASEQAFTSISCPWIYYCHIVNWRFYTHVWEKSGDKTTKTQCKNNIGRAPDLGEKEMEEAEHHEQPGFPGELCARKKTFCWTKVPYTTNLIIR